MKKLILLTLVAAGCSHPQLEPVKPSIGAVGGIRIDLRQVSANILKFVVYNDTNDNLVLDRDQVFMHTPNGDIQRVPGGAGQTYPLPAGGVHDLNVRFDLKDVAPGTPLQVHFERAITNKGQPVKIEPFAVTKS